MAKYNDGYILFDSDLNLIDNSLRGYGVVLDYADECVCSYSGNLAVINYSSGSVLTEDGTYTLSSGSIDLSSSQDATKWKKVWIYVDSDDGLVKAVAGTGLGSSHLSDGGRKSSAITPPDLGCSFDCTFGDVILAEILLCPSGGVLTSEDITDRRFFVEPSMEAEMSVIKLNLSSSVPNTFINEKEYKLYESDMNLIDNSLRGYGTIINQGGELFCSYSGVDAIVNYLGGIVKTSPSDPITVTISNYTISSGSIDLSPYQDATKWKKVWLYVDADDGIIKACEGTGLSSVHIDYGGRKSSAILPPVLNGSFSCSIGDAIISEILLCPSGSTLEEEDITDRRFLINPYLPVLDNSDYSITRSYPDRYTASTDLINSMIFRVNSSQMYTPPSETTSAIYDSELIHVIANGQVGRIYYRLKGMDNYLSSYFAIRSGESSHDWEFECLGDQHGLFDDPIEAYQKGQMGWLFKVNRDDPIFTIGDGYGDIPLWTKLYRNLLVEDDCTIDGRDLSQLILDNTSPSASEMLTEKFVRISDLTVSNGTTLSTKIIGLDTISSAFVNRKNGSINNQYDYDYSRQFNNETISVALCSNSVSASYVDLTTEINEETPDDVIPFINNKSGDSFLIGIDTLDCLNIIDITFGVSTLGVKSTGKSGTRAVWYLSDTPNTWKTLSSKDGTYMFTVNSGSIVITTSVQTWVEREINGQTKYWMLCYLENTYITPPKLSNAFWNYNKQNTLDIINSGTSSMVFDVLLTGE